MQRSTIYIKCPGCGDATLLTEMQGKYLCAACMFDYTTLKDDPAKLESVLLETIKLKGFGPVCASALYQRVMLKPSAESAAFIKKLAEKNNIELFQGNSIFAKIIAWFINKTMK